MSTLSKDVIEFLRGERRPMKRAELCIAIQKAAAHNKAWPRASFADWMLAINEAASAGELVLLGESIWLPSKPPIAKPRQQELF